MIKAENAIVEGESETKAGARAIFHAVFPHGVMLGKHERLFDELEPKEAEAFENAYAAALATRDRYAR